MGNITSNYIFGIAAITILITFVISTLLLTWRASADFGRALPGGGINPFLIKKAWHSNAVLFSIVLMQFILFFSYKSLVESGLAVYSFGGLCLTVSSYYLNLTCFFFVLIVLLTTMAFGYKFNVSEAVIYLILNISVITLTLTSNMFIFLVAFETVGAILIIYTAVTPVYPMRDERGRLRLNLKGISVAYYPLSIFTSGLFTFGLAVFWGLAGSCDFDLIAVSIKSWLGSSGSIAISKPKYYLILFSLSCIVAAPLFKAGVFPYSNWVVKVYRDLQDVYFFVFAIFTKSVVLFIFIAKLGPIIFLFSGIKTVFIIFGILTATIGAFVGIYEDNIKGVVGASGLFNSGVFFIFLGECKDLNFTTPMLYIFIYSIVTWWFIVLCIGKRNYHDQSKMNTEVTGFESSLTLTISDQVHDFILIIGTFNLIGLPPLAGFFIKLEGFKLLAAIGSWHCYLIIIPLIVFLSLISAVNYIRMTNAILFNLSEVGEYRPTKCIDVRSNLLNVLQIGGLFLNFFTVFWHPALGSVLGVIFNFT